MDFNMDSPMSLRLPALLGGSSVCRTPGFRIGVFRLNIANRYATGEFVAAT